MDLEHGMSQIVLVPKIDFVGFLMQKSFKYEAGNFYLEGSSLSERHELNIPRRATTLFCFCWWAPVQDAAVIIFLFARCMDFHATMQGKVCPCVILETWMLSFLTPFCGQHSPTDDPTYVTSSLSCIGHQSDMPGVLLLNLWCNNGPWKYAKGHPRAAVKCNKSSHDRKEFHFLDISPKIKVLFFAACHF